MLKILSNVDMEMPSMKMDIWKSILNGKKTYMNILILMIVKNMNFCLNYKKVINKKMSKRKF